MDLIVAMATAPDPDARFGSTSEVPEPTSHVRSDPDSGSDPTVWPSPREAHA